MGDHSVIRSYTPSLNRPGSQQRFKCFHHAKDRLPLKSFDCLHHLWDRGNKTQIHASGTKDLCGMRYHLPRLREVENETIEWQTILEQTDSLVHVPTKRIRFGTWPIYRSIFVIAVR